MTPKDLCDLAKRINAVEPGLVPELKVLPGWTDVISMHASDGNGYVYLKTASIAAMTLGRCWAWVRRRGDDDPPDMALVAIMECYVALRDYVQSTLPGAKQ